ncbi:MAG: hypothetical protein ACJ741_01865 [Pyrinomonadaceae bacterium]
MLLACVAQTSAQANRARESKAIPAGEVVVTLGEQTFNALIEALFTLPQPPTFPLGQSGSSGECAGAITLEREVSGARTAVHFRDGRVTAPVAFSGTYGAPLMGCLKFRGWADTALNLGFDPAKQALTARVEVREVHLEKMPSLFASGVTGLVQDALDARVNPIEILRAEQISAELPLRKLSSGGSLRLRAKDVRQEIVGSELRLHVVYEFVRVD